MTTLKRLFFKLIKKSPASMEMVSYWRTKESVAAKITKAKDGSMIMVMEGEKYPLTTYPRGYLLFGSLSKLKHEIKNQIFNESWRKLEEGINDEEVITDIKKTLHGSIAKLAEKMKYDMLPPETMCPAIREIYRAWTKVGGSKDVRDYLCLILQEDDSYRYRMMDMMEYFNPNIWWKRVLRFVKRECYIDSLRRDFKIALTILEECEIIGDMKERIRLLRRILLLVLEDERVSTHFENFCKELDWKKVFLTKGDLYHLRGKYYKADYRLFDY